MGQDLNDRVPMSKMQSLLFVGGLRGLDDTDLRGLGCQRFSACLGLGAVQAVPGCLGLQLWQALSRAWSALQQAILLS